MSTQRAPRRAPTLSTLLGMCSQSPGINRVRRAVLGCDVPVYEADIAEAETAIEVFRPGAATLLRPTLALRTTTTTTATAKDNR